MILRSASRFMMVAFVVPMVLANAGCSGNDSDGTAVRGPKNGTQKQVRDVQPQESEYLVWEKAFAEADSMFDQVWAKIHEKKEVENVTSPFTIVQEALKDTIMRQERNEKIDCKQHSDETEFLNFTGAPNIRVVQKIVCANKKPVPREIMRIHTVSGKGSKWQFTIGRMEEELGSVFVRRSGKNHIVCEANIAQDGIVETLNCKDMGRDMEGDRNEYAVFDLYRYRRSGSQRILSVEARIVNVSTHKEIKKSFSLNVKGDAVLEITLPESDEPEVATVDRLVPAVTETKEIKEGKAETQAVADKAKPSIKQTPEQIAAESEMDKVIAEYCSDEELAFVKKQVHTKAEIADSCAAGEIIREEVHIDQLPSAR